MNITIARRLAILNSKLTLWQNTYYDAELDAKIGQDINKPQMVEQATARMKEALKVIGWVETAITELEKERKDGQILGRVQ